MKPGGIHNRLFAQERESRNSHRLYRAKPLLTIELLFQRTNHYSAYIEFVKSILYMKKRAKGTS